VIVAGASAWSAYGWSIGDRYLIVPNTLGVVTNVGALLVVRRYQRRAAPAALS
jgi:Sugar efflux transporter for intercellular exchange